MPLKAHKKSAAPLSAIQLRGRVSWFGGPNDSSDSGHTALGLTTATPGIAVYNEGTLGGYWLVTFENGNSAVFRQTDIGPAPWTGRVLDVTYSALGAVGYSESTFPTDSQITAVYLGMDKQSAMTKAGESPVEKVQGAVSGEGKTENASLTQDAETGLSIVQDIMTGKYEDLGAKLALVGLQLSKDLAVGFVDLVIAPAWHWNQRTVSWYAKYVLDPKRVGDSSQTQWAFPWTAAFWGLGYVLLWTDPDSKNLKPAPVHKSRAAHHTRKLQAVPARKSLIKPSEVKRHTPSKPKPRVSSAGITRVDTMTTTRPRTVRVTQNGSTVTPRVPTASEAKIERVKVAPDGTIHRVAPDNGKRDATANARTRASKGSGVSAKGRPKARRKHGRKY